VTVVQTLYIEALRLRTREVPLLELFKSTIEARIGPRSENGVLTFSLIKHSVLIVLGLLFLAITARVDGITVQPVLEALLFSWLTMLLTTYIVPQALYRRTSGRWLIAVTPILTGLAVLVRPLTAMLAFLQSLAELGGPEEHAEEPATPAENIEALISAGAEEGIIEEDDRRLIQSAAAFGSKTVREVMTPRPNIVSISADSTLEEMRQLVIHEQFSRIPVYEKTIDQIIGFVHVRDMFEMESPERAKHLVRELARPIRMVPETKPVDDLLREMQQNGAHMAIVIDEYGNTAGLATMEDMVEEIVGEIRDEHEPAHDMYQDQQGAFIVSGSFDLDHLHELLEFRVHEDTESTTIGGLVTEWMGRVPRVGESVQHDGIRIDVLAGNELRVEKVRISKVAAADIAPAEGE
jgi:CBS domain containing-hemolysin-like protein